MDGETLDPYGEYQQLKTLIKGAFHPAVFLDLMRYFTVIEEDNAGLTVKLAAYHQYHAVNKAIERTVEATDQQGDQRVGVIWHTQGSGKSLSMLFYAGKVIARPEMANPTLVVLTDRNDLDEQLFGQFAAGSGLLRQTPVQGGESGTLAGTAERGEWGRGVHDDSEVPTGGNSGVSDAV